MADQVFNVTIKGIGDFSDVVSNVNSVQKALTKLKLPDKLGEGLGKKFSAFSSEYEKYQKKISEGIKTQGDYNQVEKSLNRMKTLYQEIGQDVSKISKLDMDSILNLDLGEFKQLRNEIANIEKEINKIQIGKINPKAIEDPMKALRSSLKSKKFSEKDTGLLDQLIGNVKSGKVQEAKAILNELDSAVKKITPPRNADGSFMERVIGKLNPGNAKAATGAIEQLKQVLSSTDEEVKPLITVLDQLQKEFAETQNNAKGEILGGANKFKETENGVERVTDSLKKMHQEEFSFNRQVQDIDRQIQSYFGLSQMIRKVGDIARDAFNTVKELDQAMTETAVVTNFSVGDMWDMLPTYTEQANKLGATIKDVYEAATLYYQQGLNTNQAMGLANETLKMARIAGMDAAEATDMMTSALRGFNMEINQASAQKVNDIYSQLAAVTASDTRELGTAMEKTASLANSANMDIETTSAFLAQMIETTREAPENLGTAMKTIIARFQEMKKDPTSLVDADGVAMDVNKVDTALKSIGVQLTNSKGEFRDLDDVFLDISKRWDSLSQGQQRYIATTAAGSRQQSRFIAMMSNYDRTMELVNEANNSAGASQKQFEKTMDSMSSKLNQLKNAWDEFTMGLMNNQILKGGVTALTGFFTVVNKIIDALGKISPKPLEGLTKSALTLVATLGGLNFGKKMASGSVAAGVGWWKNEGTFVKNFQKGYGIQRNKDYSVEANKLLQQKIENKLSNEAIRNNLKPIPVTVDTYLANIDTLNLDKEVTEQIKAVIESEDTVVNKQIKVNAILDDAYTKEQIDDQQLKKAKIYEADDGSWELKGINDLTKKTNNFTNGLIQMGTALQQAGAQLGPFGEILSTVGSIMTGIGTSLGALSTAFLENFSTSLMAAEGNATYTGSSISAMMANAGLGGSFKALGAAIWSSLGPIALIGAAIVAIVVAYKALDAAIETDAERIERLTNSANAASDTYDSLKQSTSELKSSLEEIQSNEDSFEGLVAGTTEFNDKLTETNQKIDELIQKYPELNNYLSVDKNGLKHISQEGIDFIKKQQDQLVGNASAQNILQNARLKAEQDRQKVKQNEKEIEGIKYTKADSIYGGRAERKLTSEDKERIKQLEQESKYLEENVRNAERIATQQALAASFTNIEASDRERLASMYIDSYEAVKKRAEAEKDESKMLQTYADYYGYRYDAASKKILDSNNEEIEVDKEALKGVYSDIVATIDIQASAESLDKIENSVNQKFSKGLKLGASNGENILSGVLSGDIESDPTIVKKLAGKTSQQIEETLKELTDAEMSVLMGMKEEDFAADRENLRKEFANSIKDHAQKTFEAQSQIYEDLGAKMAKSQGVLPNQKKYEENTKKIADEISKLTFEQANILNNIGEKIEENVGPAVMDTFFNDAIDIYKNKNKSVGKEFNKILASIDWESPSSRLKGYTKAIKSTHKSIQAFGTDMKQSASEANLVGDAFDEFVSGDWSQELVENADDFKNSLGEIDGAGILKAAEQSSSLKNLLDSGAVSATAVATALQGIESGKYSIHEVDSTVLQLISSLNRLEDASLEAHNFISNFDAGIDTGEGEDFVKDNAEKAAEYYKNGEWGNEQLEQYIKAAAGEERWNKTLKKNRGNLQETTKDLMKYVNTFKEGFGLSWDQMVNDKTISGKDAKAKIKEVFKGNEDLIKKYNQFDAFYNDDGYLNFKIGDLSTDNLKTYFQKIYGVSKEYADLLLQDLLNYSGTLKADLQKNDLKEAVQSKDFQKSRTDKNGKNLILTDAELRAFRKNNGDVQQLALDAGYTDTVDKKTGRVTKSAEEKLLDRRFKVFEGKSGKRRNDYNGKEGLYADYIDARGKDIFADRDLKTKGKLDLNKLIADATSWSMDDEQAMHMAFKAYRKGEKKEQATLYEGMEIESGITNYEDFVAAIEQMTETSQWVQVGETIGQQIVNALSTSNFLEKVRNGDESIGKAFDENGQTTTAFQTVVDQIKAANENPQQQQEDIKAYLEQSRAEFEKLNPEQQAQALEGVVNKLNELNFKPEDISSAIKNGLGIDLNTGSEGAIKGKAGEVTIDKALVEDQIKDLKTNIATAEVDQSAIDMVKQAFSNMTVNIQGIIHSISMNDGFAGGLATGQNNPNSAFHRVGTMARGSRSGYTISGRPTLTGEEGEELVWEPKRNEAYMVGSKGPQFANISKDAVVWNADQTKRIKKNSSSIGRIGTGARGITPFGTMAGGTKIAGSASLDIVGNITEFVIPEGNGKDQVPTIETTVRISSFDIKDEIKTIKDIKAEAEVNKVNKKGLVSGEPVKLSGIVENITVNKTKKEQPQKETKTTQTIETTANTDKAQSKINSVKRANAVTIETKANTKPAETAIRNIKGKTVDIHISPKYDGVWEKTVKVKTEKVGGSSAKGRHGTVGPDDKGGLTLTGEKGFEIAWLPSENRSMILGAGGPQMVDLPADAVVYTHEQSKDIIKRKGIPAGSHSEISTTGRRKYTGSNNNNNNNNSNNNSDRKSNSTRNKKDSKKDDKKEKANNAAISKIIVWWDNITRRADATQRKADKNQKTYEKYLKDIKATLAKTGTIGGGNAFISNTNKAINLYNDQLKRANTELKNLDKGTKGQQQAAKTKSKKDDKKENKRAFLNEQGGAVQVSYTKKSGKKSKTVNKTVATSKYIKAQDGTYVIDQAQLNKVKNKEERKALADALNKEINDRISKKNAAEDNIEKANEALEKFSEELYNTFFAWENELTKIWNITQKIEQAQSRMSRNDAYDELLKTQLSTGKLTAGAESRNKDLANFRGRLETQNDLLKERQNAITESQKNVQRILTSENEKETLKKVNDKLNKDSKVDAKKTALDNAKAAKKKYDDAIKNRKNTQSTLDKVNKKISALNKKKNLSEADKKELKRLKNKRESLKKEKESYNKIIKDNKASASKVNQLQKEYNNISGNNLNETQELGYKKYKEELERQIEAENLGRQFTDITKRADGTIDIQFRTDDFEKARLNGNITNEMAKAVQDWVKSLQEATSNLQNNYEELTKAVNEYYTQLESLQDEWVSYGDELTDIVESYEKEQIDKIKQLSDTIKQSIDKLLNDVKRKLDERRKQEENTKTERDISQKQQRLAALRADTSGGHQVEIAQLEKEIAEDQQNYRNSLEDQLVEKLQQQADLAAEQREHQIELQEQLVDSVSNIEQVNDLMLRAQSLGDIDDEEKRKAEIEALREEIQELYYAKNDYDNVATYKQDELERDFNQLFGGLISNQEKQKELSEDIKDIKEVLDLVEEHTEEQNITLENAKEHEWSIAKTQEKFGASLSELRTKGGYTFEEFQEAGYSNKQLQEAGFTAEDFKIRGISYSNAKAAGYTLDQLMGSGYVEAAQEKEAQDNARIQREEQARINEIKAEEARVAASKVYNAALDRAASNGKTSANELKSVFEYGKKIGYSNAKVAQDLARTAITWEQIAKAAKAAGFSRSTVASWSNSKQNKNATTAAKWKSYATGGLANFTGPAWLDGTPSKPELVLNSTDTRNFIALRDVLSKAMSSSDSTENSYANTEFNININVEKIADDYDVDKIITKVKKEIIKSAGYRNVTQVRSFR